MMNELRSSAQYSWFLVPWSIFFLHQYSRFLVIVQSFSSNSSAKCKYWTRNTEQGM